MELTSAATKLKTYIQEGLLSDLIQARESYGLLRTFGDHSEALMKSSYAHLFDALDRALLAQYILSIARLYDRPSTQYEIRSVPAVLAYVRTEGQALPLLERYALEQRLLAAGIEKASLAGLSDCQLTRRTIEFFESRLPSTRADAADELSLALKAVRTRRDKRLAHSEHTPADVFGVVTWAQAEALVRFAEDCLGCIAFGYLRYALSDDDGRFMLEGDAARPARALTRLLKAASITPPTEQPAA